MRSSLRNLVLPVVTLLCSLGAGPFAAAQDNLDTDVKKTLYAFGFSIAKEWRNLKFSEEELKIITGAMVDSALRREPKTDVNAQLPNVRNLLLQREQLGKAEVIKEQKVASAQLLTKESKASGAVKTDSGLIITTIKPGNGASPTATSKVTVHYHGTLGNGTVFDSSVNRGQPASFALNRVIKCWTEGLQLMKLGGKSRLVCPAELAYGDRGAGADIPPATALIFEVELLKIE